LFRGAARVIVGKGAKSTEFEIARDRAALAEASRAALGPSGNLRAPAAKIGDTWLVGFCEPAWKRVFA
jgi:hypothetical protein